jgi:hypothetical protein
MSPRTGRRSRRRWRGCGWRRAGGAGGRASPPAANAASGNPQRAGRSQHARPERIRKRARVRKRSSASPSGDHRCPRSQLSPLRHPPGFFGPPLRSDPGPMAMGYRGGPAGGQGGRLPSRWGAVTQSRAGPRHKGLDRGPTRETLGGFTVGSPVLRADGGPAMSDFAGRSSRCRARGTPNHLWPERSRSGAPRGVAAILDAEAGLRARFDYYGLPRVCGWTSARCTPAPART